MNQFQDNLRPRNASSLFRSPVFLSLVLAVLTLLVYSPVRNYEFTNYDDQDYVTANNQVKAGLSWSGIKWAFTTGYASNWHPLTWISHMLDVQFFGLNPLAHHFTSVCLHIGATVFLFLALYRMTAAAWRSVFVAALFAWHPMHVESVAWVAERKDVLSAFFGMLTLWFYALYVEQRKSAHGNSRSAYCVVLFCFALGLLAKPMLVTFPLVLLLLDFWPLRRFEKDGWMTLALEKVPLLFLSLASSVVTFFVQKSAGSVRSLAMMPLDSRILNCLIGYWRYLVKLFWPDHLTVFYPMAEWVSGWLGLLAGFGLLGIAIAFFLRRKKEPELLVGWCWFLGMLVPVIGIVQVGAQSMADRYSYLPSIGIFVGVAWFAARFVINRAAQIAVAAFAIPLLLVCITLTEMQLPHWKNTITLFEHALAVTPNNYLAHINLGSALMQHHQLESALAHYEEALALRDDMFEAHYGIAVILEKQGKLPLAAEHYARAIELRPGAVVAGNSLGTLLLQLGKREEAIQELNRTIATDPNYAEAHYNLALALAPRDQEQSIKQYKEAVRLKPDYADAMNNLAVALANAGKFEAAVEQLRHVVQLHPQDAEAHFNLSFVLLKVGQTNAAKEHYDIAFKLNPDLARKK